MIYISAAYFAQYHADLSEVEEALRQAIKSWPHRAWIHVSEARDQIGINWSQDADPQDIYTYLGLALDAAAQQLAEFVPADFVSVTYNDQDHYYSVQRSWSDMRRNELTEAAQIAAA